MKGFNSGAFSEKSKNSKYGIVYTTWNTEIVSDLLEEAWKELIEQGVDSKNIITKEVPGAFELPLAAKLLSKDCSTVIALGAIIRGGWASKPNHPARPIEGRIDKKIMINDISDADTDLNNTYDSIIIRIKKPGYIVVASDLAVVWKLWE